VYDFAGERFRVRALQPKTKRGRCAASQSTTPQSRWRYFFFDAFFDFFAAFFLVAIMLTTFHAVRDLTVALTWHYVPDRSDKFFSIVVGILGDGK
jgi:hypothetical protein